MSAMTATVVTVGDLKYELYGTEAYVAGVEGNPTNIVIPATIQTDGLTFNVTSVASEAFEGNTTIKSVESVGSNLLSIYSSAFKRCTSLTSVSLPSATRIVNNAFDNCTSLTSVSLPSATYIGYEAFFNCSSLISIKLPKVKGIYFGAFAYCSKLQNVLLGDNLEYMLGSTSTNTKPSFYQCIMLSCIVIPASCTIHENTFGGCDRLQAIIYKGTQTGAGGSYAKVYNINNMVEWSANSFPYTGNMPQVTFTNNLPMGFQAKSGNTVNNLSKDAGSHTTTVPITFANSDQEFTVDIPYSYTITPDTTFGEEDDEFPSI